MTFAIPGGVAVKKMQTMSYYETEAMPIPK